ncbi:MAG: hypothetical protein AAGK32_15245 [Actinomycetota bacterium]
MSTDADATGRDRLRWWSVPRDVLLVSGPDAAAYLQGQVSQDVEAMEPGDSAASFVLQPSGKVDAWFRISRRDEDWVLDVDEGHGDALQARLTRFLLRTDATVEPLEWTMVAVRGDGAATVAAGAGDLVVDPGWPGVEGVDVLGADPQPPDAAEPGDREDLEGLRIEAGVPAMGAELDGDTIQRSAGLPAGR